MESVLPKRPVRMTLFWTGNLIKSARRGRSKLPLYMRSQLRPASLKYMDKNHVRPKQCISIVTGKMRVNLLFHSDLGLPKLKYKIINKPNPPAPCSHFSLQSETSHSSKSHRLVCVMCRAGIHTQGLRGKLSCPCRCWHRHPSRGTQGERPQNAPQSTSEQPRLRGC